ncbi:MAG: MlaD family protein [Opitutales bacterium]|nr:MlaD family protein [Opitutales bacterium]
MSQKCSPTLIGIFVVSALAILVGIGAVLFNNKLFKPTTKFVMYFDSSMNGLDVGAPVKFKGVRIGEVKSIDVSYDTETGVVLTPVIVELNSSIFAPSARPLSRAESDQFFNHQIMGGLAAKLSMESIITGKLFVELDYHRPNKARFYGKNETKWTQIPTVRSAIEKFMSSADNIIKKLSAIDFGALSRHATSILASIDQQIQKTDLRELVHNFSVMAVTIRDFFSSEMIQNLLKSIQSAAKGFDQVCTKLPPAIDRLEQKCDATLEDAQGGIHEFIAVCRRIEEITSPESDIRQNVKVLLLRGAQAIRSLQSLLDLLNKSPNALLTGVDYGHDAR